MIGHEISHGFDDQGRKIDATGAVQRLVDRRRRTRFEARRQKFGEQYAKYEAVPGAFINPELTMGENIADLAGAQVAYDAYHESLGGKPAPVIDGLTGDQRFFLAFAQAWRSKQREDRSSAGRVRSAQPGAVPDHRPAAQPRCLVRRVRHRAGFQILHRTGEARPHLVIGVRSSGMSRGMRGRASSAAHFLGLLWVESGHWGRRKRPA